MSGILFKWNVVYFSINIYIKNDREEIKLNKELAEFLSVKESATRDELFVAHISKANDALKTKDLIALSESLAKYVKEHLGAERTKDLQFDFNVQDEWAQFKYLDLTIRNNGVSLPVHKLGNGFQSLIVISIFRTYLEIRDKHPIFLIEEPEMFLHTHAKKYFYSILHQLSEQGNQILYTTHATEFVDIINAECVKRVVIKDNSTKILPAEPIELDFNVSFSLFCTINSPA